MPPAQALDGGGQTTRVPKSAQPHQLLLCLSSAPRKAKAYRALLPGCARPTLNSSSRFESLSRLSLANEGKHFRSDPVRAQSTHSNKRHCSLPELENRGRYNTRPEYSSRAYADCSRQKFRCGRPQRSLLGLYRPQSAVSCSTLRERAA